jgi:hypothetical protein
MKTVTMMVIAFLLVSLTAMAETNLYTLGWSPSENNEDGTAITEPIKYRVEWRSEGTNVYTLVGETTETYMISPFRPGVTNYYNLYAVISGVFESADNTQTWESASAPAWATFLAPSPAERPSDVKKLP